MSKKKNFKSKTGNTLLKTTRPLTTHQTYSLPGTFDPTEV